MCWYGASPLLSKLNTTLQLIHFLWRVSDYISCLNCLPTFLPTPSLGLPGPPTQIHYMISDHCRPEFFFHHPNMKWCFCLWMPNVLTTFIAINHLLLVASFSNRAFTLILICCWYLRFVLMFWIFKLVSQILSVLRARIAYVSLYPRMYPSQCLS